MSVKESHIAVSRSTFGFVSDIGAFRALHQINHTLGTNLGLEVNPHRLATAAGFRELSKRFGIEIVGVHGPLQGNPSSFIKDSLRNLIKSPPDLKEAVLQLVWCAGFGAQKEPNGFKRYRSSMELAQALNAYLVMHHEPLQAMGSKLVKEWAEKIQIVRENGWGPKDGRKDPLSWNPHAIKAYATDHRIGTLFDISAAVRAGQDILTSYSVLQPDVIHFSDSRINGDTVEENIIPGKGNHTEEMRELLSEVRRRAGIIIVVEVSPIPNPLQAIQDTIEFIEK